MSGENSTILTPYLNFNGNAGEAMKFYQSILGGALNMQTFGEANMAQGPEEKNLIVHARLQSQGITILASDTHPSDQATFGDNVHLSLMGNDEERLKGLFDNLSRGGRVEMPLAKQFWGDTFGMLTDKFGIHWMVNVSSQGQ